MTSKKWRSKQKRLDILPPKGPDESELIGKVDLANKDIKVYLVKMPEYLAEQFEDPKNGIVGRLRIPEKTPGSDTQNGEAEKGPRIFLDKPKPSERHNVRSRKEMITEYDLEFQQGTNETLVFSSNAKGEKEDVQIEGGVLHQCHAKPKLSTAYSRLTNIRMKMSKIAPRPLIEIGRKERIAAERDALRPTAMMETYKQREERKRDRENARRHLDVPTEQWTNHTVEAIFEAFSSQPFYTADNLARDLDENVTRLRPLIQKYCQYTNSGPFAGHYHLNDHLQTKAQLQSRKDLEEKHREQQQEMARRRRAERADDDVEAPAAKKQKRV